MSKDTGSIRELNATELDEVAGGLTIGYGGGELSIGSENPFLSVGIPILSGIGLSAEIKT